MVLLYISLEFVFNELRLSTICLRIISLLGKISTKIESKCMDFYAAWGHYSSNKALVFKSVSIGIINQILGILSI